MLVPLGQAVPCGMISFKVIWYKKTIWVRKRNGYEIIHLVAITDNTFPTGNLAA